MDQAIQNRFAVLAGDRCALRHRSNTGRRSRQLFRGTVRNVARAAKGLTRFRAIRRGEFFKKGIIMFGLLRRRRKTRRPWDKWGLDTPLFSWDASGKDVFTIRDASSGVLSLGRTGSGKTSGSGRQLALSLLAAGYGGLILTVKPGELAVMQEYCRMTGRLADLRVVDSSCQARFNFLDEMAMYQGAGAGLTENLVSLFLEIAQIGSRQSGPSSNSGENDFFNKAVRVLLRNLVDLMDLSIGHVSAGDLCKLVTFLPCSRDEANSEQWQQTSPCAQLLAMAKQKPQKQPRTLEAVEKYILHGFPSLADRTRSSITATFEGLADLFQRGLLFDLLSTETTLSPRDILNGAIILVDLPLKLYGDVGLMAQLVWKMMTQRCLERQVVTNETRPTFIMVDEAQFFASQQSDALFTTTCRAFKVCNIFLSQSIAGFVTAFGGGPLGEKQAEQLLANFSTKIIHALADYSTAEWASNLIGREYRLLMNSNSTSIGPDWAGMAGFGATPQSSAGFSESLQYEVEPREFNYLRTGGPESNWLVDAIAIRSGNPFAATGKIWRPVTFCQK
jgi:hypothetical protein